MDKLTLNNQIVSMRQEARKAKLHTISKLVREVRKLRSKNGSEDQKKKNNRKADRFMEEVLIIKKLKDDEISKFALCNSKMSSEIIFDLATSLKDKALTRLSKQPSISTRVSEFRMKFPAWDVIVPQLLLKLGDKKAKKKKENKSKTCEDKEKDVVKSYKEDQAELVKSCTIDDISEKNQAVTSLNPITIHSQDRQQKIPLTSEKKPKNLSEELSRESVRAEIDDAGIRNEMKIGENSLAEVKRFTEHLKSENNIENNNLDLVNPTPVSPSATIVDPFFVCEDGKTAYLTSVKGNSGFNEGSDIYKKENLSKQPTWIKNDEKRFFQAERRKNLLVQKPKMPNFRTFQQRPPAYNSENRTKQSSYLKQKINIVHNEKNHSQTTDNTSPIHPSWEAKKKLKEQQCAVFAFQGKKIKFDD
ncbi:serum response factor-binding protein 1 isoform X2 [Zootermopsis nevadensis]|uniref:Serum response factor-binding protein 1 n=1 Tax=Zootermopsis nevadensis TaxID=136037 RepID=A0A067QTG2_ZOONE|nr:serum response factor-binding protein 1 isoform X2 [Zootermopsis nevadensis]KDR07073.1 Serum response factor-binding protein 1 [Zootermopsis nevadensis]